MGFIESDDVSQKKALRQCHLLLEYIPCMYGSILRTLKGLVQAVKTSLVMLSSSYTIVSCAYIIC